MNRKSLKSMRPTVVVRHITHTLVPGQSPGVVHLWVSYDPWGIADTVSGTLLLMEMRSGLADIQIDVSEPVLDWAGRRRSGYHRSLKGLLVPRLMQLQCLQQPLCGMLHEMELESHSH